MVRSENLNRFIDWTFLTRQTLCRRAVMAAGTRGVVIYRLSKYWNLICQASFAYRGGGGENLVSVTLITLKTSRWICIRWLLVDWFKAELTYVALMCADGRQSIRMVVTHYSSIHLHLIKKSNMSDCHHMFEDNSLKLERLVNKLISRSKENKWSTLFSWSKNVKHLLVPAFQMEGLFYENFSPFSDF